VADLSEDRFTVASVRPSRASSPGISRPTSRAAANDHIARLKQLKDLGVDQFAGYLQHDNKEETLRVYGETIMPALRQHVTART
jgi:hypothetical protein